MSLQLKDSAGLHLGSPLYTVFSLFPGLFVCCYIQDFLFLHTSNIYFFIGLKLTFNEMFLLTVIYNNENVKWK